MDEIWERAIKTALDGETDSESVKTLTLDGAVKCFQVRFPPPCLLEKFCNLEHLSIANAGVSSLENFPNLPRLHKLVLSDNRIAGGLEYLVRAGLGNLRDLDLSNNRIQFINDLVPLAELKIMSLDLYECPVTKVVNYRGEVFGLVRSVKYLDKMDENQNERLESDDDDDDEDEEEEEEVEMLSKTSGWGNVVDVDEDEESDADEEESEMVKGGNSAKEEGLDDEDDDVEEIDEEDSEDEEVFEVHEVHEIDDSDDDEDEDSDDSDDDEDAELEEVDDEEEVQPASTGRLTSAEVEIDGHDSEEDDENGEIGEEEVRSSEEDGTCGDDDLEDEDGTEFLVQPAGQHVEDVGGSDFDAGEEDDYSGEEDEVDDGGVFNVERRSQPSTSPQLKRKRDEDDAVEEDGDDDEKVENGDLKSHPSMSAHLKKNINGAVDDAKDEGGQKSIDSGKVEKAPVKL